MPDAPANSFLADALDANRRGELTENQRRNLGALSASNRRNLLSIAAYLFAGAALLYFFASRDASPVARGMLIFACVAIATVLIVRSATGSDPLTRDLRRGRVETAEGAIGKRRIGTGRGGALYFVDVGNQSFKVGRATHDTAPDAGHVRVYFLPGSRRIVNFERLPDAPVRGQVSPAQVLEAAASVLTAHDRRGRNEAQAEIARLGDAVEASFSRSPVAPPAHDRDSRPLAEAIVGTWTNAVMTVTFVADGSVAASMFGTHRDGRWSVDRDGHLRASLMGRDRTAEAWIAGDQLTIAAEEGALTFTRKS